MVSFVDFLRRKKFVYISDTERRFNELKEGIKKNSGANASDWKILGEMQQEVNRLREREISKESERVGLVLEEEIIRNYNQRLARKVELDHDPFVKKAVEVLSDPRKYSGILHP
jgi:carboxyl-terminal processing protease